MGKEQEGVCYIKENILLTKYKDNNFAKMVYENMKKAGKDVEMNEDYLIIQRFDNMKEEEILNLTLNELTNLEKIYKNIGMKVNYKVEHIK